MIQNVRLAPDSDKVIRWPQNRARWVIFYYLVGDVIALYLLMLEEMVLRVPIPHVVAVLWAALICPAAVAGLSVVWAKWRAGR